MDVDIRTAHPNEEAVFTGAQIDAKSSADEDKEDASDSDSAF